MQSQSIAPRRRELLALNAAISLYAATTIVGSIRGIVFNVLMPGVFEAREGASASSGLKWALAGQITGAVLAGVLIVTGILFRRRSRSTVALFRTWFILQAGYTVLCIMLGDEGAAAHPASSALLCGARISFPWVAVAWGIMIPLAGLVLLLRVASPDQNSENCGARSL